MSTTTIAAAGSVAANNAAMQAVLARNQRIEQCREDPQCEVLVVQQCDETSAIEYALVVVVGVTAAILFCLLVGIAKSMLFGR